MGPLAAASQLFPSLVARHVLGQGGMFLIFLLLYYDVFAEETLEL
jgi:hypothetical protein